LLHFYFEKKSNVGINKKQMPKFSQGFVLMLGILVFVAILYITVLIFGSIWIHNYRKTAIALAYSLENGNFCDCTNGGKCQLIVDYNNLKVPLFPIDTTIPDWPMIYFAANLVASVEAPWAYNTPETVIRDAELWAEGNIAGIVCHQNDIAFIAYKGTVTKEEWKKNFEFKETSFAAASDTSGTSRSMKLGCGCGGGGKGVASTLANNNNSNIKKKQQNQQSSFISSYSSSSKRSDETFEVGGHVHSGFLNMYNQFSVKLVETLERLPVSVNKLIISGHSLGASLATLTLADSSIPARFHENTICYAIASPRVGDDSFTLSLGIAGRVLFRLVNIGDIVNEIPLSVTPNKDNPKHPYLYSHSGTIINFQTQRESLVQNHLLSVYIDYIKSQLP
jgi:hypothetical protein